MFSVGDCMENDVWERAWMGLRLRRQMASTGVKSYTWVGINLLDKVTSANSGNLHNQGDVKGHS